MNSPLPNHLFLSYLLYWSLVAVLCCSVSGIKFGHHPHQVSQASFKEAFGQFPRFTSILLNTRRLALRLQPSCENLLSSLTHKLYLADVAMNVWRGSLHHPLARCDVAEYPGSILCVVEIIFVSSIHVKHIYIVYISIVLEYQRKQFLDGTVLEHVSDLIIYVALSVLEMMQDVVSLLN